MKNQRIRKNARLIAWAAFAIDDEHHVYRVIGRRPGEMRTQTIGQVEGEIYFVEFTHEGCFVRFKSARKAHEHEEWAYLGGKLGAEAVLRSVGRPTVKLNRVVLRKADRVRIDAAGAEKLDAHTRVLTRRELREFKSDGDPGVAALRRRLQVSRARLRRFSLCYL